MGVNLLEEEAATRLTRALFPRVFVSVVARSAVCVRVCGRVVAATYKCNPCVQGS